MDKFSFITSVHSSFLDNLYERYIQDPDSLDEQWRYFFKGYDFASKEFSEESVTLEQRKEFKVINLISAYRSRGHLFTKTNPVRERRTYSPDLNYKNFGLDNSDLDVIFQAGNEVGLGAAKLRDIISHLQTVYCQSIGVEFSHLRNKEEIEWLKSYLHKNNNQPNFSFDQKRKILNKLNSAIEFENFVHKKFVGQKRFSVEGGESIIPCLDYLLDMCMDKKIQDVVIGMAHRGRLNVLSNILGKDYEDIFNELKGKDFEGDLFDGYVIYHLGFSNSIKNKNHRMVVNLCPNPSHLESVGPVVQGICRSKIDKDKMNYDKTLPVIIHGDAALAGQGVCYETIQMSQLKGYKTGGTIHVVINNQLGFTTNYIDARSSTYCTDIGKIILSPIFHVNGDDVEAVLHVMKIAFEYRQKFKKDIFIDLLCYRKYGHNEGDEPRFTQPILYNIIKNHPNQRDIYAEKLLSEKVIDKNYLNEIKNNFSNITEDKFEKSKSKSKIVVNQFLRDSWNGFIKKTDSKKHKFDTTFDLKKLLDLGNKLFSVPEGLSLFNKSKKIIINRNKTLKEGKIDWGTAELLAYATLMNDGFNIRMSGQDVERGTFSHRHAILKTENTGDRYSLFNNIQEKGNFNIYNSLLSEFGVLGFEYGYSLNDPNCLTIWEAQFGDFFNGAQIIFDQYISAAESKWNVMSGLVMFLPHGYEGQGPEHSSARIERFLQLCAQDNLELYNCTTPANFFHFLRMQMKKNYKKPSVVFTPKSLLRHKDCISELNDLAGGEFQPLIYKTANKKINKVVFCTGKIYYDLNDFILKNKKENYLLVRIEQLYPFPLREIKDFVKKYNKVKNFYFLQEEPTNMGAGRFVLDKLDFLNIEFIARKESCVTASGSKEKSNIEQNEIINKLFN